jgi:hypothetical protein
MMAAASTCASVHAGFSGSDPVEAITPSPAAAQPQLASRWSWRSASAQNVDIAPAPGVTAADGPDVSPPLFRSTDVEAGDGSEWQLTGQSSMQPQDSGSTPQRSPTGLVAIPYTQEQDIADVLHFSPEQQQRQPASRAGHTLGDLLNDAERAHLSAMQNAAAPVAQHSLSCSGSDGNSNRAPAFLRELQQRHDVAEGLTPCRRIPPRHRAADSVDRSQRMAVPESPLGASLGIAPADERAELAAALACRTPSADVRSMCREGNVFGRFAFVDPRPAC